MKHKILVVDDSYYMRVVLKNLLSDAGHEIVGEAGTGEEALKLSESKDPDLIMLDLILPDTTGLEVLKVIHAKKPDQHVIIVSAVGQDMVVEEALENGADAYIVKPFNEENVLQVIGEVMSNAKS